MRAHAPTAHDPFTRSRDLQRADPRGHRAHLACAMATCFFVTWPTSVMELSIVPIIAATIIRGPRVWRAAGRGLRDPVVLLGLALAAWLAITLLWSADPAQGASREIAPFRWLLALPLLAPVIHARFWLVRSMIAGFFVGNAVQALNAWAIHGGGAGGPEIFAFGRAPDRLSGWWDPAVSGVLLTAALGLHLPGALLGRGRDRWAGLGGVGVTLVGLLMTGARGGWIASAGLIAVAIVWALWTGRGERRLWVAVALIALVAGAGAVVGRDQISTRVIEARDSWTRAQDTGDYFSPTGARVLMAQRAVDAFVDRPVRGVGAGGYELWAEAQTEGPDAGVLIMGHAHNTPLHLLATGGLPALVLALLVLVQAVRQGARLAPRGLRRTILAGPPLALLGIAMAGMFDTVTVSASSVSVLGVLLALCPRGGPRFSSRGRARGRSHRHRSG